MINNDTVITNPAFVRLGNNVCLSTCTLLGHDGVVAVLNRAYNMKLDSVGKIDIKDNIFVGMHAIIMPDVTIGPNAVVAAGAVVANDVAEGDIVVGIPARPIGKVENLVNKLDKETSKLPWANLLHQREGGYDPDFEPELTRRRVESFLIQIE